MKPVLKYRGGKASEIPHFRQYIPEEFDTYLEPFLGGGAVFFHLEPERAIVNDVNPRLMTFYWQLRDQYPAMRAQLDELHAQYRLNQDAYRRERQAHPDAHVPNANEELYYRLRRLFNHPTEEYLDGVLYFFLNKTAYSGMLRYNRNGEYNVPFGRYVNLNTHLITPMHSALLQRAALYCADYNAIFDMAGPRDFMFLDPPYDCIFHDYGNIGLENGFGEEQHRRLAADFRNLPCRALMIIGKTALTEELYSGFVADEYAKSYAVNIRNRFRMEGVHLVVKNF